MRHVSGPRLGRVIAAAVFMSGSASAGCAERQSDHAVIVVDAPVALADRPVHMRIEGLVPDDEVIVSATAPDHQRRQWRGQATFRADSRGTVVLDEARPISGTYAGADGMGLFWSMNPPTGDPEQAIFGPRFPELESSYPVQITVAAHGRLLARQTLTRRWLADGVTHKTFTVSADEISGELFLPPAGTGRRPAVLLLGGSEGGNSFKYEAALLASHGYPSLSLAYFGEKGLPATLQNIPLDYFARAARLLARQPGVDPARLVAAGVSRGTEAALLLGQNHPDLVHGIVVYAPSSIVIAGFPNRGVAWTANGRAIEQGSIPLDRVDGPVLAIAGTEDALWTAANSARVITAKLDALHKGVSHQALIYQGAGHKVATFPYLAAGTRPRHPATGAAINLGGTRAANAAAQQQGWPKVLAFLADMER
ncbi:acyl-CoA thioesterase/BAAT N-terminal domain-containing protein [Actinomadura sp. HBU206391]|nr:acyl-CoA thioesterase/BAAT N-terminal domain-containing protein [Actinomadura sp. HBU206391]